MSFFRKHRRKIIMFLAILLAILMVLPTLASVLSASALSSSELAETRKAIGSQLNAIGSDLSSLQAEADGIQSQMDDINSQLEENAGETRTIVEQKADLDRQTELLEQQIENTNSQIQEYNRLIAARQADLDTAEQQEQAQMEKYRQHIRSMEENGTITYISVVLSSTSIADLLDRIDMIREVAEADQLVMEQLKQARLEVEEAQNALLQEKDGLQAAKDELAAQQEELNQKRAEADQLISSLYAQADLYTEEFEAYEKEKTALDDTILEVLAQYNEIQSQYNAALSAENAAKAEEKAAAERAAAEAAKAASTTTDDSDGESDYYIDTSVSESGFLTPVSSYVITDTFGPRTNPVTGVYGQHTGVDLAADSGSNVYASKSGTVVEAAYNSSYGNYVLISHGDSSTMYAHLSSFACSAGDYVVQGQTIGYVGSTGNSTGPHLHFEIIIDGTRYNPLDYIS